MKLSEYTGAHPPGSPVDPDVVDPGSPVDVVPDDDDVDIATSVVSAPLVGAAVLPPVDPVEPSPPVTTVVPPVAPESPPDAPPAQDTSNSPVTHFRRMRNDTRSRARPARC